MRIRDVMVVAAIVVLVQLLLPCAICCRASAGLESAQPASLDLAATERTIAPADEAAAAGASITAGQTVRAVVPGSLLTPAEHIALQQVLTGQGQSLILGELGNAVGGSFVIPADLPASLNDFRLPEGVTAVHDFASRGKLDFAGSFVNAGTFYAVSSAASPAAAAISAHGVINQAGALLTSILPAGGLPGMSGLSPVLDLRIVSGADLVNYGTISSSGSLSLAAAQSLINSGTLAAAQNVTVAAARFANSGSILAGAGNIDIAGLNARVLAFDNAGGLLAALNGAINFGAGAASGWQDIALAGGSIAARELNLNAGAGVVRAELDKISATVNTYAHEAHVSADTETLTLGQIELSGDPTYYNSGNIVLTGDVVVSERLAIIGRNITSTAGLTEIRARDGSGQGYDIHLVAGAAVTPACGPCSGDAGAGSEAGLSLSLNPLAPAGGSIDLSASPDLRIDAGSDCPGCSGGNVTLVAFADGSTGGRILLAPGSLINTSGNGSGNNGNVTLIAGAQSGTAVSLGAVTADGGSGASAGTGTVSITTAQPTTSNGGILTFSADGSIASGNSFVPEATIQPASVLIHAVIDQPPTNASSVIADIGVTTGFQSIALNRAGTLAYAGKRFGNTVSVVDTATSTVLGDITVGTRPQGIVFNHADSRAYVANQDTGSVSVIDTATATVVHTITGLGAGLAAIDISPDDSRLYVANRVSNSLTVIDTATNQVVTVIPVGASPLGVAAHPSGTSVYVANYGSGAVSVIDATANSVVATVPTGGSPSFLAVDPTGSFVYVPSNASGRAFVIRTADNQLIATVPVGYGPLGVDFSPDGALAYVVNSGSSSVSVVDTQTHTVVETVPVGFNPRTFGSFVRGAGSDVFAYITNLFDDHISVLKTPTAPLPPPPAPFEIVASGRITVSAGGDIGPPAGPFGLFASMPSMDGDIVFAPARDFAYVNNYRGDIQIIDTASNSTVGSYPLGRPGAFIEASPDGLRLYVANPAADTVSVVDRQDGQLLATIPVGPRPRGLALDSINSRLYVVNNNSDTMSVIDTTTDAVIATVTVGLNPTGVVVNPITNRIYVSNFSSNDVTVVDGASTSAIATIPVPSRTGFNPYPGFIAISPSGDSLYVSSADDMTVSVINTATNTVVSQFQGGGSPSEVVLNRAGSRAYVVNNADSTVSVVDTASERVLSIIPVGAYTAHASLGLVGGREVLYVSGSPGSLLTELPAEIKPVLAAPAISLSSSFGIINVDTRTASLSAQAGGPGSVFVGQTGPLDLGASSAGFKLQIDSSGPVTTTGQLSAANIVVRTLAGDSAIIAGAGMWAVSAILLSAHGTGSISTESGSMLVAPSIVLASAGGNISVSTDADMMTANTGGAGSVYISESGSVALGSGSSSAGNYFQLSATGPITVSGPLAAADISLTTTANSANIYLAGSVTGSDSLSITTDGAGQIFVLNNFIARSPVGQNPWRIALGAGGARAYVVNASDAGSVTVFDTTTNTVIDTIAVGIHPRGIAVDALNNRAYVSVFDGVTGCCSGSVSVIDLAADQEVARIAVGTHPVAVAINSSGAAGTKLYVVNQLSNSVSVVDLASASVEASIPVGSNPTDIVLGAGGTRAYVVNIGSGDVSVVDLTSNTVVSTVPVGGSPISLARNPAGDMLYVTDVQLDRVSVIDAANNTVVQTIPVGRGPRGITINPTGTLAFVANFGSNTVSIIDLSTNTVVADISSSSGPSMLTSGLVGGTAALFVTNESSGTLAVIGIPVLQAPRLTLSVRPVDLNITPLSAVRADFALPLGARDDINNLIPVNLNLGLALPGMRAESLDRSTAFEKTKAGILADGQPGQQYGEGSYFHVAGHDSTLVFFTNAGQVFAGGHGGSGGVVCVGAPGTILGVSKSVTVLHTGRVLASSSNHALTVGTAFAAVTIPAGASAVMDLKPDRSLHVMAVGGEGSPPLMVNAGGEAAAPVVLRPGEEMIVADSSIATEDLLPADGLEHQIVTGGIATSTRRVLQSQFSLAKWAQREGMAIARSVRLRSAQLPLPAAVSPVTPAAGAGVAYDAFGESRSRRNGLPEGPLQVLAAPGTSFRQPAPGTIEIASGALFLSAPSVERIETALGQVLARRGALVSVEVAHGQLRVKGLSGPGLIEIAAAGTRIPLNLGEEVLISDHRPTRQEAMPSDGVGRRNQKAYALDERNTAVICEFSLVSMLSNSAYMQSIKSPATPHHRNTLGKIIKAAAARELVSARRGGYQAQPRSQANAPAGAARQGGS